MSQKKEREKRKKFESKLGYTKNDRKSMLYIIDMENDNKGGNPTEKTKRRTSRRR